MNKIASLRFINLFLIVIGRKEKDMRALALLSKNFCLKVSWST